MNLLKGLNIMIAPIGALFLVVLDYWSNKSADKRQKLFLLIMIASSIGAMLTEILTDVFEGVSGALAYNVLYTISFLFFIFQLLAYSSAALFLDYNMRRDPSRLKYFLYLLVPVNVLNLLFLIFNIGRGFYFYIAPGNIYMRGSLYIVRVLCSYFPLSIVVTDFLISFKVLDRSQVLFYFLFSVPTAVSAVMDIYIPGSRIIWPVFSFSVLTAYLFLVRSDSRIDSLTGLNNRRFFDEYLISLNKTLRRKPCTFIMIDVDHFKDINDTLGHAHGDSALRDIAQILKSSIRRQDFLARHGGDEFVIIIMNCSDPGAVLERINETVNEFNNTKHRPYSLQLSIGYDVYDNDSDMSPPEFLSHVDSLMYKNKGERRSLRQ